MKATLGQDTNTARFKNRHNATSSLPATVNPASTTVVSPQIPRACATPARATDEHLFVNNVRFLGMVSIIAIHAGPGAPQLAQENAFWALQLGLVQALKFGTIGFFLISGFLLGERLGQYDPVEYLRRRMRNTVKPWAAWATVFLLTVVVGQAVLMPEQFSSVSSAVQELGNATFNVLFHSVYWFIPNFLIALGVLLAFRRWIDDWRFGAVLGVSSLLYGVNVYTHWFPSEHTTALFGFVFYLWLGVQFARHFEMVSAVIGRIRPGVLIGLITLTGILAFGEMALMRGQHADDPLNTLRISNQLYSVAVFVGLFRVRTRISPGFVDVRANTFGLYLMHPISLWVLTGVLDIVNLIRASIADGHLEIEAVAEFHARVWQQPVAGLVYWVLMFVGIYGLSLLLTRWIVSRPHLKWLVGQ